jgi:hypothetical protein
MSFALLLLFSCTATDQRTESITNSAAVQTVSFAKKSETIEMAEVLMKENYTIAKPHSDYIFYDLLTGPPQSTLAVDIRAQSFSILHLPTGVHSRGTREMSIRDIWGLHRKKIPKERSHITAYGGAPWFSGSKLKRASLIQQIGGYFHRIEEKEGLEPFLGASPFVFAAEGKTDMLALLQDVGLGLSCSSIAPDIFWCTLPPLDLSCVEKTQKWISTLYAHNLKQPTEGMYRSVFRNQEVRLCLPSGCYDCNTISCANNASSEGMPISLTPEEWSICLEKSFDEDAGRTRVCLNQSSFAQKELSIHVDDCRIP